MKNKISEKNKYIVFLCLTVFATFFAVWTFTGKWPLLHQPYNSYMLQAQSWLSGRLDIAENYSHLEIAEFNGKYYISFPPFPSYVMLPFALLGLTDCDGVIALVSAIVGAVYAFKLLDLFGIKHDRAFIISLLLTIGSNWLFTAQVAWVWFIAQNMAFTLSVMALYYALSDKSALALAFWACAVGCRPLQFLYLPVILVLIYKSEKQKNNSITVLEIVKDKWKCVIPMAVIALSYMALNYARFGNPIEFGHNYLPEFTESEHGQFSVVYLIDNLKCLLRLPGISFNAPWEYQPFNGTNMFIVSPIFVIYVIYAVRAIIKNDCDRKLVIMLAGVIIAELVSIALHKTMGGSQFGNRYTNDCLPIVLLSIAYTIPKPEKYDKLCVILLVFGICVNAIGSALYFG